MLGPVIQLLVRKFCHEGRSRRRFSKHLRIETRQREQKKNFFLNRSSINKWISNRNFPSHLLSCWWVYTAWFQLTRLWSWSGLQWHSSGSGYNYVPLRQKPQRVGKCTLIWECQLREANTHTAHRIFIYWYVKVTGEQFVQNKDLGHIDISCYTLWKLFPSVLQAGASYLNVKVRGRKNHSLGEMTFAWLCLRQGVSDPVPV